MLNLQHQRQMYIWSNTAYHFISFWKHDLRYASWFLHVQYIQNNLYIYKIFYENSNYLIFVKSPKAIAK